MYALIHRLNTKTRLTMLCLSGFELYSRWVLLSLGRHVNAASRKSLEIQAYSITKPRTLLKQTFV